MEGDYLVSHYLHPPSRLCFFFGTYCLTNPDKTGRTLPAHKEIAGLVTVGVDNIRQFLYNNTYKKNLVCVRLGRTVVMDWSLYEKAKHAASPLCNWGPVLLIG